MNLRSNVHIPGVPDDLAKRIAQARGEVSDGQELQIAGGKDVSDILPVSAGMQSEISLRKIGERIYNNFGRCTGIYIGTQKRVSEKYLTQIWDLYAAPTDLKTTDLDVIKKQGHNNLLLTFNDAVAYVNDLTNWYGYDGKCLISNTYQDGWFIPPARILHGHSEVDCSKDQHDNLYDHREKMPECSKFIIRDNGLNSAHYYWSCNTISQDSPHDYWLSGQEVPKDLSRMDVMDFAAGALCSVLRDPPELSTRLVRAELRVEM